MVAKQYVDQVLAAQASLALLMLAFELASDHYQPKAGIMLI
jgi:hypothetical protein